MLNDDVAKIRKDYQKHQLLETNISKEPFKQFSEWLQEAINAGIEDATAMTLATISTKGFPSARIVLLKGFDKSIIVYKYY